MHGINTVGLNFNYGRKSRGTFSRIWSGNSIASCLPRFRHVLQFWASDCFHDNAVNVLSAVVAKSQIVTKTTKIPPRIYHNTYFSQRRTKIINYVKDWNYYLQCVDNNFSPFLEKITSTVMHKSTKLSTQKVSAARLILRVWVFSRLKAIGNLAIQNGLLIVRRRFSLFVGFSHLIIVFKVLLDFATSVQNVFYGVTSTSRK